MLVIHFKTHRSRKRQAPLSALLPSTLSHGSALALPSSKLQRVASLSNSVLDLISAPRMWRTTVSWSHSVPFIHHDRARCPE
ncbi:uncharacterized protein EI97DRAFT_111357 [Westerdykella ornata]|uniref:Uncharacterized protein n=1 Tax=Westerdykella ornata TaxID=318751 RepID=A0A6A6JWB5_WESOR|nr:uncharacterized protein EI97DRAFT_111357 [Westerdykella ornata]KAF2280108.1 hypothetical protein EI97DRAFT_111357 [Westerdykella ornata]